MALNPICCWLYYKEIVISDTGNVSADYQMMLTIYSGNGNDDTATGKIYCNNKCKDFPDDIRFGTTKNPATATSLYFWEETSDAVSATIWVKCPSDGSNRFHLFIGRANTDNFSDGANTFIAFDDFDDYIINEAPKAARGWTFANDVKAVANPAGAGKVMQLNDPGANPSLTNTWTAVPAVRIWYKSRATNATTATYDCYIYDSTDNAGIIVIWHGTIGGDPVEWWDGGAYQDFVPALSYAGATWYSLEQRLIVTGVDSYVLVWDGVSHTGGFRAAVNDIEYIRFHRDDTTIRWVDDFRIGKYHATPPTWSSFGPWATPPKEILHLDEGPHPYSRMAFYPRLTL